jgi:hypothetical protein
MGWSRRGRVQIWEGEGGFVVAIWIWSLVDGVFLAGGEICASARSWTDGEEKT